MAWIDYAIMAVPGLSCLVSPIHGFIREALSLMTWGYASCAASHYYIDLSVWFTDFEDKQVRNEIAITALFIVALIVDATVGYMIDQLMEKTGPSGIDRVLGICFGTLRRVLIIATILFPLGTFTGMTKSNDWHQLQFVPYFIPVIRRFFKYLQNSSSLLPKV